MVGVKIVLLKLIWLYQAGKNEIKDKEKEKTLEKKDLLCTVDAGSSM